MKAYLFDMDGTLVDSLKYWRHGIIEAIESFGDYQNIEGVAIKTLNKPIKLCCPYFVEALGMDITPEELWERIQQIVARHYREDARLFDGVYEYLGELRAQGIPMAVVSATAGELVGACLEACGIRDMFEFYLSSVDYGIGKEDPRIFLDAAKKLGFEPKDICLFDDSPVSLRTAKALGFYTVGVYEPYNAPTWDEVVGFTDGYLTDWKKGIEHKTI